MPLRKIIAILFALTLVLVLAGCKISGGGSPGDDDDGDPSSQHVGVAQKGPFEAGAEARATRLGADGTVTADSLEGRVLAGGDYELPEVGWSGATLISLNGTYFDETSGSFSGDSLELHALADAGDAALEANVNLYTHFVTARARALMSSGDDFAAALATARGDLGALVGITSQPSQLDVIGPAAGSEDDSANLLLYSAALLSAGHSQAEIDAIASDFADDGLANGSVGSGDGQTYWREVQQAAGTPGLLDTAQANLESQYSKDLPEPSRTDFGWLLDACTAAKLNSPRVVCVDDPFYGNHRVDSGEWVTFIPAETGYYTVELFGDPNFDDDNTNSCSFALYAQTDPPGIEYGDSAYSDGFCGVEDVTYYELKADQDYFIRPLVTQMDDMGPDARFVLSMRQVTEGNAGAPNLAKQVYLGRHEGVVGTLMGTTTSSYYRFAGAGSHSFSISGYPCSGSNGEFTITLFEGPGFNNEVGTGGSDPDACSQTVEANLQEGTYYLEVTNRLSDWNTTFSRPAPGAIDFYLDISKE